MVACRLFARRRVSGWSRLADHIGAAFVPWDMPSCRVGVGMRLTSTFVIHVLSCSYLHPGLYELPAERAEMRLAV